MRGLFVASCGVVLIAFATPAVAQVAGRLTAEPYVAYGFFGGLPDTDLELEGDVAFGGRVAYRLGSQWAVFGNFQRSTPTLTDDDVDLGTIDVDHWSVGGEFSYFPRGGAEGLLPVILEAGIGQARYENGPNDFAANLGVASAFLLTPNIAIRYGLNDYISNYGDNNGIVNQIFGKIGVEVGF